jgi:hypothetical protein
MTTETKKYKLSQEEKLRMSNRINYFRTMPTQILKTAANLESGIRNLTNEIVNHEIKSVLVNGRIMILNMN